MEHPSSSNHSAEAIRAAKRALRRSVTTRLAGITTSDRAERSEQVCDQLRNHGGWAKARFVLLYAPTLKELDIWPLVGESLAAGKIVALPRFVASERRYGVFRVRSMQHDIQNGYYGIREPTVSCESVPLIRLDFVLVPGVAFDLRGRRLGRGKGYYDRLLAEVRGRTCGVAFDEQIVETVPVEPHDTQLNCILTPTRLIEL
jgi:5-formyltetrahydrofolate cyclo-ligase